VEVGDVTKPDPSPGSNGASRRVEEVVLVDEADRELGTMAKLRAHEPPGALHRAFSVFLFNDRGELLLQRRAGSKHHFAGRWSNTCCSHPRPGESVLEAGRRRLDEELGVTARLSTSGSFTYEALDPVSGLVERELDHVLVGRWSGDPAPDPAEVGAWRWVEVDELRSSLEREPSSFTPWLPLALPLAVTDHA
jgi:isopentenyl-diphosphate delta-isomerase